MNYARVVKGKAVETVLPKNGYRYDGRAVSNYRYLPEDELRKDGWLPVEIDKPKLREGQSDTGPSYTVEKDKIVKHYEAINRPVIGEVEQYDSIKELKVRVENLEKALQTK